MKIEEFKKLIDDVCDDCPGYIVDFVVDDETLQFWSADANIFGKEHSEKIIYIRFVRGEKDISKDIVGLTEEMRKILIRHAIPDDAIKRVIDGFWDEIADGLVSSLRHKLFSHDT